MVSFITYSPTLRRKKGKDSAKVKNFLNAVPNY